MIARAFRSWPITWAHRGLVVVTAAAAGAIAACSGGDTGGGAHGSGAPRAPWEDSVLAALAMARAESTATLEPGALGIVVSAPVVGFVGPDGAPFDVALRSGEPATGHTRRFGLTTMPTSLRGLSPVLGQHPCTSCHFGRRVTMTDARIGDAHQNIQPVHPARVGAVCSTCHAPDDVETLALRSGERPSLDHAYRLCAQCHFAQADAWAGGAHGKRLDGWQGRRVLMGCTDCHDPHQPVVPQRVPFRAPELHRREGSH